MAFNERISKWLSCLDSGIHLCISDAAKVKNDLSRPNPLAIFENKLFVTLGLLSNRTHSTDIE
jgi:hypothetical protein